MKFPKTYNPKQVEDKTYKFWLKSGFFNPDKLPKSHKKPYTIVLPPPNITGQLHMGHALNSTIQDILIRWKRMQGFKTLWLPGTDHAGIATQNAVEKQLKKEGLTRFDLGRKKFIEEVWKWKKKYGNIILEQLKKLGASCDWSRTRFTMDNAYSQAAKKAFLYYYEKGWIYQGKRVVNWCPRCATSLSDLELEYKEEKGKLWYIKYKVKSPGTRFAGAKVKSNYIIVATTRPETMLGDTAVAINPKDKRYKNLIGKKVILPLINKEIPIIADRLVDLKFGSGAVKITPAHDLTDYKIGLRHNLEIIQVIDEKGRITKKAPLAYQGLKVLEAREKIVENLKKQGFLEKIEDYVHQIPKCYRCNTTIELIPSQQWFLKMEKLAKIALSPVKKREIKFYPRNFEKSYFNWLKNIEDWCISRQIWWGHTLPIWQCQIGKKSKIKKEQVPRKREQKSKVNKEKYFISLEKPKKCPICGKCRPKQVNDVLDTWFSSALWPFATLGWPIACAQNQKSKIKNQKYCKPKKKSDLEIFYPTNVLSTARDIINLWVARMIFSGTEFMKKIPFSDVYIHATILTKEGKRMSKSLGTGIDPIKLIDEYGADATRFGITYQVMGNQDMKFVADNIVMGKKFSNKIWNASRFVLQQISKSKRSKFLASESKMQKSKLQFKNQNLTSADKKILKQLDKTIKSINKDLENFRFGKAAHSIYNFFWHDFCDRYIEAAKKQSDKRTNKILIYVLLNSLKLLHPFMPFISEEIYQKLPISNKKKSLMIESWPFTFSQG